MKSNQKETGEMKMPLHNWGVLFDWSEYADENIVRKISKMETVGVNISLMMSKFDPDNDDAIRVINSIGEMIDEDLRLKYGLWDQIDDMETFIDEVSSVSPDYEMWYDTINEVRVQLDKIHDYAIELSEVDEKSTELPRFDGEKHEQFGDAIASLIGAIEDLMPKMTNLVDLTSAAEAWENDMWEKYEAGEY